MEQAQKKRLKIAFVVDVFDNTKTGGVLSAKRFVDNLRENHDVTVISTGNQAQDKTVVPSFYVPIVRRLMEKNQFIFAYPEKSIIRKALADVDLVHIQLPFFLGCSSIKIARELGKPVVTAFHVQPENITYNIGIPSSFLIEKCYRLFVNKIYNRSDAVICPSKFAESELKRYGLTVPSYVISNGLLPQFRPIKALRDKEFKDKFIILTVGRIAKDKRHDVLIDAVALSKYEKSIQLIITGKGPLKEKIEKYSEKLTNKPPFKFVTEDELIRLYNTSDIYIHPSEVELESMSVLEAIGCGLPALISDSRTSAAKQFALNEKFIFNSGNPYDLARRIDYWIEHRQELKRSKQLYHKKAIQYKIDQSIQQVESLYRQLVYEN